MTPCSSKGWSLHRSQDGSLETVAFDLAHLAARAVAELRTGPGSAKGPVAGTFECTIGDWDVRFNVFQAAKRGDLRLAVEGSVPHDLEMDLPGLAVDFIRAGKPVFAWGPNGVENLTDTLRSLPRPGDI